MGLLGENGAVTTTLTSVEVRGDQVTLEIAAAGVSFTATLTATQLTGTWSQLGNELAVTMVKE